MERLGSDAAVPAFNGEAIDAPEYEEPQGETERAIAKLWQEVFGLEQIGRNANFFELGGNSLLGMTLMDRFDTDLSLQLPVVMLFQNPTIRELAELISPLLESQKAVSTSEIRSDQQGEHQ
jgi:hypothetical protein